MADDKFSFKINVQLKLSNLQFEYSNNRSVVFCLRFYLTWSNSIPFDVIMYLVKKRLSIFLVCFN